MSDLARVRTNITALRAYKTLSDINKLILQSSERLSTGRVLNSAADSPSGWYVARMMRLDISKYQNQAHNIERGTNWLQTNDSRLSQVVDLLTEMSDIAYQADSGGVTSAERIGLQIGLNGFLEEIQNILESGVSPILYTGFTLGELENVALTGSIPTLTSLGLDSLVLTGDTTLQATRDNIKASIEAIGDALSEILKHEEVLGTWIHRLEFQAEQAALNEVTTRANLSTIEDADLAYEQLELTKLQILQQTALAMLTQANIAPASLLSLLGGTGV
jgi:flagellin